MLPLALLHALTGAAAALLVEHTLGLARRKHAEERMMRLWADAASAHPVEMCPCEDCVAAMAALDDYHHAANAGEPDR